MGDAEDEERITDAEDHDKVKADEQGETDEPRPQVPLPESLRLQQVVHGDVDPHWATDPGIPASEEGDSSWEGHHPRGDFHKEDTEVVGGRVDADAVCGEG